MVTWLWKHVPLLLTLLFISIYGLKILGTRVEPVYDRRKFILPRLLQRGINHLTPQGRATLRFGQHYAAMVAQHQIIPDVPAPWLTCQSSLGLVWGQAESPMGGKGG